MYHFLWVPLDYGIPGIGVVINSVPETYSEAGLHESLQPCSQAARKWRENEEMRRKWRENEEMERD